MLPVRLFHPSGVRLPVLACALLLLAGSVACSRSGASPHEEGEPDAAQLFERACARCHASDGSGGLAMVPNGPRPIDLRQEAWQESRSDAEIVSAIRDGRGAMPPFHDVLREREVVALARYVRQLRAPGAASGGATPAP